MAAVQLVRVGDGKVAHIGIYHEGWRPICGAKMYAPRTIFRMVSTSFGRKPSHLCDNCQIAVSRITALRLPSQVK